jgi:hypothetical protein
MSSCRGPVAHTGKYDGADGYSNPNYHKGILFQNKNRFPFARKIYLNDSRKESEGPFFLLELDPPPKNAYMHIQTDMHKYMHIYFIYIHIHTHTYRYRPIHVYTHTYIHIHTHTYPARRMKKNASSYMCMYTLV